MPSLLQSDVHNRLLRAMSEEDFALLAPDLVPCKAEKGYVLFEMDEPTDTVWFMELILERGQAFSPEAICFWCSVVRTPRILS